MKTKFNGILTLFLALVVQISFAQQKTITGIVSDESGSLPGVSVLVKGTSNGTETDFDGKYSIKAKTGDILVFRYLGYKPLEKTVGTSNTINAKLLEDSSSLDEVVVVAYGSQSRASLTGSVSVIDAKQIENATFSNPVKSLEGLVSGLRVVQGSGQPGSDPVIRIRGFGSINADSAPLIVLDGVPYSGSLSSINPQDILSTTVLKDASSTSLYGNKASNGVLMITTKKGSKSKTQISIDTRIGITQRATKDYNVIGSPQDFYEKYHSVLANSEFYSQNAAGTPVTIAAARQTASNNLIGALGYNLYDVADNVLVDPTTGRLNSSANLLVNDSWEDALFRDDATFSSTNLNISGGSEDVTYYFSLGSDTNKGYTVGSDFKRQTARLKVSSSNIAKILTLNGDVSYTRSTSQSVPATLSAAGVPTTSFANTFAWTRRIAPIFPVYQYDENWNPILDANNPGGFAYDFGFTQNFPDGSRRGPRSYAPGEHPLAVIENTTETNEKDNFNGAFRAKFDLPFGVKFEYVMNYLTEVDKGTDFTRPGAGAFAQAQNGLLTNNRDNFSALTNQQLLTWKKDFGSHSFDVLLGHETYEEKFTTLSLTKYNIIGGFSPILDNASVYNSAENYNTRYLSEGYFSRFIYGLDNTYYFTLTGRYDASSSFHPEERWGLFGSAGASWLMSNEDFLKDSDVINFAKLSVNYGTTGNDRLFYAGTTRRNFLVYENQSIVSENDGALTLDPLFYLGGRDVTWEKSASLDVAYEIGLFNRLNISLGYYRKETRDLLFNSPLQPSTGRATRPQNAGNMVNSGFETEIGWNAVQKDNFNVNFNFNLSTLNNEVTQLPFDNKPITLGNFRREVGRSIFEYYLRKFAGVNPVNGDPQYFMTDATTGDVGLTDDFTLADRDYVGKEAIPDVFGGFGVNLEAGNFSLGLQFAYQLGGYGLDSEYFGLLGINENVSNIVDYDKTWTVDNPTASLPRVDPLANNQYVTTDLYLVDQSYLSLNNINFGYILQNDAIKKYHIDRIRFYGTMNNAFLLYSARQGYDPRLSVEGASSAEYGANRTIAFGVNINLN